MRRLARTRAAPASVLHLGCGRPSLRTGETSVVSTASWAPPHSRKPEATTSSLLPSAVGSARFRSRTNTLVETLAPASLHILAAALSNAAPRCASTPAVEHAARWSPSGSKKRRHQQREPERGSGRRSRLSKSTRNRSDQKVVCSEVGSAVNGLAAPGPAWESNTARLAPSLSAMTAWLSARSLALEALRCQPLQ